MIAFLHFCLLENLRGIHCLVHGDETVSLMHLDPKVKTQVPQITHLKELHHLLFEALNVELVCFGDQQIIDLNTYHHGCHAATNVDNVLRLAPMRIKR